MKVFFRFMIEIFARRTWTFLFLFILLMAGATPFILKLKVKPNWKDLLPSDSPSVVNLEKLGKLYGSEGFLVVGNSASRQRKT